MRTRVIRWGGLMVLAGCAALASAQELRIVNAASLAATSVAPGSIITIFGTKLASEIGVASDVQKPPVTLDGVTVSIGGVAAALFYVSPTQINAVVDPKTPLGSDSLVVTSASGKQTGTVKVDANAPPGLFSLFASGTRDGAILNAVTFLLGDFSTHTANSLTFLALFATGLNLAVKPVVTIGGVPVEVTFFGAAPCCDGLQQINVRLLDSLAGAGRVPVVVMQNGVASNTVQVVLLPPPGQTQFPGDDENTTRSREIASAAWVPGTSLVLVADQNDDVVRVIDVKSKKVTQVIALSDDSDPVAIAVTGDGSTAVVAESGIGKVAVVNLSTFKVTSEIATGPGPVRVAISGSLAVVANADNDTVSIVNLANNTVLKTLEVGRGPEGIAIDSSAKRAYVLNEDDGSITVIDLANLSIISTTVLDASLRLESIALTGTGFAFITAPSAGPNGQVILYNLTSGAQTALSINPNRSGGASDVLFFNGKVYFVNQAGGTISVVSFANGTAGAVNTIKAEMGPRALTVDVKDNLLVVTNEGSGSLTLIDLSSGMVVGRIDAVRQSDSDNDDHEDHNGAPNAPVVQSVSPISSKVGATFTIMITGSGFSGAKKVIFLSQGGDKTKTDSGFTVSNISVNSAGTQLTATVTIAADARTGARLVLVATPNGTSNNKAAVAATFNLLP